jgi:formamidase
MAAHVVEVDIHKSPADQSTPLHNRWHPEIPALLEMAPGSDCRLQCLDFTGGQINTTDDAGDVEGLVFDSVHPLTGPIAVRGAKPGDLLVVDILDVVPLETWGFSMIFPGTLGPVSCTRSFPTPPRRSGSSAQASREADTFRGSV